MLDFDFTEALQSIDYRYIELRVNGFTQIELEQMLIVCEEQVKNSKNYFEYEVEEAKVYINEIEERMMNISSAELVAI